MLLHRIKIWLRNKSSERAIMHKLYSEISRGKSFITRILPDELYIRMHYRLSIGRKLNLDNPVTYTEKVQWLKLYDRKPLYTQLADKIEVKKYVESRIGKEHIVPTYGVWDKFDDIDFDALPDSFVLKCNHDCGSVVLVKDKNSFNKEEARKKLNRALKRNYYWGGREWQYKNIPPKIFAEKLLEDETQNAEKGITDYKVFCFNGHAKLVEVVRGRYENLTQDYYDVQWTKTTIFNPQDKTSEDIIPRPVFLKEMIELSELLSSGITLIRVDWFHINGALFSGEMTLYEGGGFDEFGSYEQDKYLGGLISLPSLH